MKLNCTFYKRQGSIKQNFTCVIIQNPIFIFEYKIQIYCHKLFHIVDIFPNMKMIKKDKIMYIYKLNVYSPKRNEHHSNRFIYSFNFFSDFLLGLIIWIIL